MTLGSLSACGSSTMSGVTANEAQAYTCGEYNTVPANQTDRQHQDQNDAVVLELLKLHGYPQPLTAQAASASPRAETNGSKDFDLAEQEAASLCSDPGAKVDDTIEWASPEFSH